MPLQNRYYLSDTAVQESERRPRLVTGWRSPLWVLPRAWCVNTSLHVKGIPRHKTAAFIRLHLNRLAPFVDSGVFACRAGDWVHLWFWENQRVRDLCQRHDLDFETIQLAPESVCLPKIREGAISYRCIDGYEAQLWHNGLLIDSAWWPENIDASAWEMWRPTATASTAGRNAGAAWPEAVPHLAAVAAVSTKNGAPILLKPWASNLLGRQWWNNVRELRLGILIPILAGSVLGLASYWTAQWLVLEKTQASVDQKIVALSARVEPLNIMRGKALDYLQWTAQVAKLNNPAGIGDLLKILQPVLQQHDAALREFEYNDSEVRLVLVPINGEFNIGAVVQQLEALPKLTGIQLLPDSDARIMRVSAKIRPFLNAGARINSSAPLSPPLNQAPSDQAFPAAGMPAPRNGRGE